MQSRDFWISLWAQKGSKPDCPFCGNDRWIGWDDRVRLPKIGERGVWPEGVEVIPLTCSECHYVRLLNQTSLTTEVL